MRMSGVCLLYLLWASYWVLDYGFRDIMQVQPSKVWDFNFIFSSRSFEKPQIHPNPTIGVV
jgi:hypothetical protein